MYQVGFGGLRAVEYFEGNRGRPRELDDAVQPIIRPERAEHEADESMPALLDGQGHRPSLVNRDVDQKPGLRRGVVPILDQTHFGRRDRQTQIPGAAHGLSALLFRGHVVAEGHAISFVSGLEIDDRMEVGAVSVRPEPEVRNFASDRAQDRVAVISHHAARKPDSLDAWIAVPDLESL